YINWNSTWLYVNYNQKSTYNLTNFKLNQSKSFKIKTLLNELPTQYLYHKIYPLTFYNINCFHCNSTNSSLHWYTCANPSLLDSIISNAITDSINLANLDFSNNQIKELIQKIKDHSAFNKTSLHSFSYYLKLMLKGFIPLFLTKTIQDLKVPYKLASTII